MNSLVEYLGVSDAAVRGPAITGLFSFFGVLITGSIAIITWFLNQLAQRREAGRLRREQCRDLQLALWAEILTIWLQCLRQDANKSLLSTITERFDAARTANESYTPSVASPPKGVMFEKLKGESVLLLQVEEIADVVAFYRHLQAMTDFASDLRDPGYANLSLDRKEQMLIHFINMGTQLQSYAEDCLAVFERKLRLDRKLRMRAFLQPAAGN